MLTANQFEKYQREGWAVAGPLLEGVTLDRLRSHMDEKISRLPPGRRSENMPSVHYEDEYLRGLFLSEGFVDDAEQILGPDVALFTSYAISKPPGDGKAVVWHQDAAFFPIEPMRTFTLWLAVDDSDRANGCMQVVRGTNKDRRARPHLVDQSGESALEFQLGVDASGETDDIVLAAGHYSVHDPFIIHGSDPNRSQRRRCGITIKYLPTSIRLDRSFRSPTGFDWTNVQLYHARGSRAWRAGVRKLGLLRCD